jgi:hypothetical protein
MITIEARDVNMNSVHLLLERVESDCPYVQAAILSPPECCVCLMLITSARVPNNDGFEGTPRGLTLGIGREWRFRKSLFLLLRDGLQ